MHESVSSRVETALTLADEIVHILAELGVRQAWGVIGGGCAPLAHAIGRSQDVELIHARHESGAAFAALEASAVTGRPVLVFATTGPGVLNALNGCMAARWDG
ncbi:MAG TPA: thiamine pyrophosphate-binding protein, partial [Myxococcota bacterium]